MMQTNWAKRSANNIMSIRYYYYSFLNSLNNSLGLNTNHHQFVLLIRLFWPGTLCKRGWIKCKFCSSIYIIWTGNGWLLLLFISSSSTCRSTSTRSTLSVSIITIATRANDLVVFVVVVVLRSTTCAPSDFFRCLECPFDLRKNSIYQCLSPIKIALWQKTVASTSFRWCASSLLLLQSKDCSTWNAFSKTDCVKGRDLFTPRMYCKTLLTHSVRPASSFSNKNLHCNTNGKYSSPSLLFVFKRRKASTLLIHVSIELAILKGSFANSLWNKPVLANRVVLLLLLRLHIGRNVRVEKI